MGERVHPVAPLVVPRPATRLQKRSPSHPYYITCRSPGNSKHVTKFSQMTSGLVPARPTFFTKKLRPMFFIWTVISPAMADFSNFLAHLYLSSRYVWQGFLCTFRKVIERNLVNSTNLNQWINVVPFFAGPLWVSHATVSVVAIVR